VLRGQNIVARPAPDVIELELAGFDAKMRDVWGLTQGTRDHRRRIIRHLLRKQLDTGSVDPAAISPSAVRAGAPAPSESWQALFAAISVIVRWSVTMSLISARRCRGPRSGEIQNCRRLCRPTRCNDCSHRSMILVPLVGEATPSSAAWPISACARARLFGSPSMISIGRKAS